MRTSPYSTGQAPAVQHLDLNRPAAEQIYAAMKSMILRYELEPGQAISENEIGQSFSSSRTPVREALSRLREEGLIVTLPSRGTYVSRLSERQIIAAQFTREALEVAVVTRLCQVPPPPGSFQAVEDSLHAQQTASREGDREGFRLLDDQFHVALAAATGIERLEQLLMREKAVLDRLRVLAITDEAHMNLLLSEHRVLYARIREQDLESALSTLRVHLRRTLGILASVHETNRHYFE